MSNERPNEFLPWRAKLIGTDALPEQGLDDKEQSWQRLAERLGKQPRRRGIAWWIAAACLILAFFLPATHIFRGRPGRRAGVDRVALHPSVQPQPLAVQPKPLAAQPEAPAHAGKPILPVSSNYGEIAAVSHLVKYHSPAFVQTPAHDSGLTAAPPIAPNPTLLIAPTPTLLIAPNLATALPPGATPPARRPLRIAYLNELGKDPGPAAEPSFRRPSFLQLGTARDWTTTATNTSTIKIDLFPHNH